jgi:hypothetical protein
MTSYRASFRPDNAAVAGDLLRTYCVFIQALRGLYDAQFMTIPSFITGTGSH